jgi:alpha-beta hydrolase superfamily lysophospholipase
VTPALWILAGGVLALAVILLDRLALSLIRPARRPYHRVPREAHRVEEASIPAPYLLRGWLLHPVRDEGRPLVILCHGWGGNGGTLLPLADALVLRGHPTLLFDVRGHGRSEGAPYVTIRHFRDDVTTAFAWMAERFPDRKIAFVGHSMGGAAAVLAAAEGTPVHGLALVAAPADVLQVTAVFLAERGLPGRLVVRLCRPFWTLRIREWPRRLVPERRIRELRVPVIVIQPGEDRRVSPDQARRLARAAGTDVHIVGGASHTNVLEDPETHRLVSALLDRVAAGDDQAPARSR